MNSINKSNLEFFPGNPSPMGVSPTDRGLNFAVYSDHSSELYLILYTNDSHNPMISVSLDPQKNRSDEIWHIEISGLPEKFEYGYKLNIKANNTSSGQHLSSPSVLNDPYARVYSGGEIWGKRNSDKSYTNKYRSLYTAEPFDWEDDKPLNIPLTETIIYELHQ